ncbi:MAG: hypothetical protein ACR2KK_12450, partial [Acidimicrobiales bacterium]
MTCGFAGIAVAPAAQAAATVTLDGPMTDNYKTKWNPAGYDERRTSIMFRAVLINGVRYTT